MKTKPINDLLSTKKKQWNNFTVLYQEAATDVLAEVPLFTYQLKKKA